MSEIEQGIPTAIPDILTPGQYYEGAHRDDPETQAIKRLMFAVLTDAVRCFQIYCRARVVSGARCSTRPKGGFGTATVRDRSPSKRSARPSKSNLSACAEACANGVCIDPVKSIPTVCVYHPRGSGRWGRLLRRALHMCEYIQPT
jgi:hypothetical protein